MSYSAAGVAAGLDRPLLSATLQTLGAQALLRSIFVVFAGSMFGFYELQLPSFAANATCLTKGRPPAGRGRGIAATA